MRHVQLRAFHHVAISGGFSRAAEALFLTQPAISDQVRKLEEEYDILLFDRSKRQVRLTAAGQRLLEITNRLFDAEQQALELLTESRTVRAGTLRVVADAAHHLLHILERFRQAYPGVTISLRAGNTQSVMDSLHGYEADIGVLGEIPDSPDFEVVKLNDTPIVAFVSAQNPLAGAGSLTLAQLAAQPLVLRERGSKTRQNLEDLALACGLELRPAIEAEGREAVRELVAAGGGVGFVSAAEFGSDPRLAAIAIDGPAMIMHESMICLRERSAGKLVRAFFDIAKEEARSGQS